MKTKLYLHSSKDTMYEKGAELGLSEKQLEKFVYGLYEVELDVEVDKEGNVKILKVDGKALKK